MAGARDPSSQASRAHAGRFKGTWNSGSEATIFGKADWITVGDLEDVPYNESALSALGLKPSRPTVANFNVLRWTNVPGFVEIAAFPSTAGIDCAYIKTTTP